MRAKSAVAFLSRGLIALAACCLAPAAPATDGTAISAPATTVWTCWHNGKTRILCRLSRAPEWGTAEAAELAAPYPGQMVLPLAVREIREQPMRLYGRTLVIPMFSTPELAANSEMLADAVMCGARPACRVDFFHDVAGLASLYEEDPALD